jgi:hypothetical protein
MNVPITLSHKHENTHCIQVFDALGSLILQSTLDGYNTCVFVHGAQVYSVILTLLNYVIRTLRLQHLLPCARRPGRRENSKTEKLLY